MATMAWQYEQRSRAVRNSREGRALADEIKGLAKEGDPAAGEPAFRFPDGSAGQFMEPKRGVATLWEDGTPALKFVTIDPRSDDEIEHEASEALQAEAMRDRA